MDRAHPGTWAQRLAEWNEVDVRPVPAGRGKMTPGLPMLYPSATMVNDAINALPEGETITVKELKSRLAANHNAHYTCPVTMVRAVRVVLEAANEAVAAGAALASVTPVWRAVEPTHGAWRKLSFDPADLKALRER